MSRLTVVFIAVTALITSTACGKLFNPNGPSGGGGSATFMDEGVRFPGGVHPAPLVTNGTVYVYQNTATDGVTVQASSDGLTFAPTPATYPAGVSRSIVRLPDGRFRMYYYADGTGVDVRSALSSNGFNWTVESGIRFSEPDTGGVRALTLPTGVYRLYYATGAGTVKSAMSGDGVTFVPEGEIGIPRPDNTFGRGTSAAAYVNGQFHMILTKVPSSGVAELWHAVSGDGRNWNVDSRALAVNPGVPLNQPAWGINGGTTRIYYRASPPGGGNAIGSGIIRF